MASSISAFFKHNPGAKAATVFSAGSSAYLFYQSISDIDFSNGNFKYAQPHDVYMFIGANVLACATIGLLIYLYCNRNNEIPNSNPAPTNSVNPPAPDENKEPSETKLSQFLIKKWGDDFLSEYTTFKQGIHSMDSLRKYGTSKGSEYSDIGWEKYCRSKDPSRFNQLIKELDAHAQHHHPDSPATLD